MTTAAFRVPELDSENVVYSTGYRAHDRGCRVCGGERAPGLGPNPRIYCCRKHKQKANQMRRKYSDWSPRFSGAGVCPYCGTTFRLRRRPLCTSPACREVYDGRGFWAFKQQVKWPHPLAWLAPKINRAPDDPLLPKYAVALALKGLLVVYVRADGTVGEVGRPKAEDE